jgi:hypothetical protein
MGWTIWQAIEDSYVDHASLGYKHGAERCTCGHWIEGGISLHQAWACAVRLGLDPEAQIEPWPDGQPEEPVAD